MNILRHILAKDLRRLRWPLVAWLVLVISRVALVASHSDFAFEDFGLQLALENVSGLLMFIDLSMLVLIVSWLVHDEPLIGADAFWLTRPIRPATLMASKLVFAALFLIGAPVVAQSTVVAGVLRSPGQAFRVIPGLLLSQALWVVALLALAALTASLTRFLLALVAGAAVVAVAFSAMLTVILMTAEETSYPGPMMSEQTTGTMGSWLLLAVALVVIGLQYRTRRLRLALSAGVVGLIATASLMVVWPVRFARLPEPDPGAWAADRLGVAAILDLGEPFVSSEPGIRRRATPKKLIAAPIRIAGVPPQYGNQATGIRSRLEFPDGSAVQSAQGLTVMVRRDGGDQALFDHMAPFQAALQPTRLLRQLEDPRFAHWPVVLTVTADEYARYGRMPGRLTATVEAFLQESRLVGSLPLVEGATLQAPSAQFELRRVLRRPDGCSVLIRQVAATGRQHVSRPYQYFLRNAQRREAVSGDHEQIMGQSTPFRLLPFAGWSFDTQFASPYGFWDHAQRFPASGTMHQIDTDWIAGADLAVMETTYAGRVSRSLVVEGFRMSN